jgi:hypothetical protein
MRSISIGADGYPRLSLLFLDSLTSERLLTEVGAGEGG